MGRMGAAEVVMATIVTMGVTKEVGAAGVEVGMEEGGIRGFDIDGQGSFDVCEA